MSFKKIISQPKFWPAVFIMVPVFIVFFNIIRVMFEYKLDFSAYFSNYLQEGNWFSFVVANIIGGLAYGFIVVYIRYWRHFKEDEKKRR